MAMSSAGFTGRTILAASVTGSIIGMAPGPHGALNRSSHILTIDRIHVKATGR